MGIFSDSQSKEGKRVYSESSEYLKKDGKTRVIMYNSFSKWLNQSFGCEDKYTVQINEILSRMQDGGFEIIDVKFNSLMNQGRFGELEGFHTLITYRYGLSTEIAEIPFPLKEGPALLDDGPHAQLILRNGRYCCSLCGQRHLTISSTCNKCGQCLATTKGNQTI